MRILDAILDSSVSWGIVSLVLIIIGTTKGYRLVCFALALFAGVYGIYRFWSKQDVQDYRLIISLLLLFVGGMLLVYFLSDPRRPVTRWVMGELTVSGSPVASLSVLNVGASSNQEAIPNPPGWIEPKTKVSIIFRESVLLTDETKRQITTDVSAFREYFLHLGIPVSDEIPPIGVSAGPGSGQIHVQGTLPLYRSDITISHGWFVNRRAITWQYADYAIHEVLARRRAKHPTVEAMQDIIAGAAISQYFNWSYWEDKPANEGGYWSPPLWQIRSRFGKAFTDRLVAFAIRTMIDNPEEGADPNFDLYFYRKLQQGDSVIDNDAMRMGEMTEIIKRAGIDVAITRAYLGFSADALRRNDGSFALRIFASSKNSVPASRGKFRVYTAPDVDLTAEPKGALSDTSSTLRSSRWIPFETISAGSRYESTLEFRPISDTFFASKFFVVHFDYQCESCGIDTYSHDLKFELNQFGSGNSDVSEKR
jgi:hypothetical protein